MDRSDLSHCPVSYPVDASLHFGMGLDLTTGPAPGRPRNKWLDQLRNDSTRPIESSGDVLSTVDMVVQRRNGPRRLREHDDDDDDDDDEIH